MNKNSQLPKWLEDLIHLHNNTETYECGCDPKNMEHCIAGVYLNEGLSEDQMEDIFN